MRSGAQHRRRLVLSVGLMCFLFALGALGTWLLGVYGRAQTRFGYLRTVTSAAAGIDAPGLLALSASPADAGTPALLDVKRRLVRIREAAPETRFVYLMAQRGGEIVFLADAEPIESPDASGPGDPYPEASAQLHEAFMTRRAFVEGPLEDAWGEWVTGFAPILNEETGAVVAVLGLDWDARAWRREVAVYHLLGLALTAFPILLTAAMLAGFLRIEQVNCLLSAEMEERQRVQQELERLSKQDPLTGLANRRTFDMLLDVEWRRALRAQLPLSVIMIDVDWFKAFNDLYGHQRGDKALRQVADAIRAAVKRAGDDPARYGGEEFVVIIPGAHADGAYHVAELIRQNVEQARIPHRGTIHTEYLTVSAGVATTVPGASDSAEHLVKQADQALYRAKAAGRNRTVRFVKAESGSSCPDPSDETPGG